MNVSLFSNEVKLEDERVMKLDYILTEGSSETEQIPFYGVKIIKFLGDLEEADEIAGVSETREDAVGIIRKLYQFQVTPISMPEIVDELITLGM
jgi:hypothetical protein